MRVIEDILLSERDGEGKQGQWPCVLREQGREMVYKKVQV